jgi:hypothetical protein
MNFYIPSDDLNDWAKLLANPIKQWVVGKSARTLAHSWIDQKLYPKEIENVFNDYGEKPFKKMKFLFVFPEYKVDLPPCYREPSHNDIFIIGRGENELVSICVEGKVSESFGTYVPTPKNPNSGMPERLSKMCESLGLVERDISKIRYQLLHRTLSSVTMAKKLNANYAMMLVHSFSESNKGFNDFTKFTMLFGVEAKINKILESDRLVSGKKLYFAWVKGDKKYLQY